MKDDREFADGDGRTWRVTLRPRERSGLALRFQSGREVRFAPARDDWERLPDERLRRILETEATPTSSDDEGLHGLSDAPGG